MVNGSLPSCRLVARNIAFQFRDNRFSLRPGERAVKALDTLPVGFDGAGGRRRFRLACRLSRDRHRLFCRCRSHTAPQDKEQSRGGETMGRARYHARHAAALKIKGWFPPLVFGAAVL